MTKSNPGGSPPASSSAGAPITPPRFCTHCGHAVLGEADALLDYGTGTPSTDAAFCCNCGAALDDAGKCPNGQCKFRGFTPRCG
jgi:hypothetical protein